ncbi:MAG TPA: caspase family protein [Cyclobacteriaceae bacterium]
MKKCLLVLFGIMVNSEMIAQGLLKIDIKVKSAVVARYSPDNTYLAVADNDKVRLYNAGNDTQIKIFEGHSKTINDIGFDSKGERLVTASADKTVIVWNMKSGVKELTLNGHEKEVRQARFAAGGKYVVSISEDMAVMLWDSGDGKLVYSKKEHTKPLRALAVSQEGDYFITGGGDKTIVIWETETGNVLKKIPAHSDWIRTLAVHPDGKSFASGSYDKTVATWSFESGERIQEFTNHRGWIYSVNYSADGKYIAAASADQTGYFYEVASGNLNFKLDDFKNELMALEISPKGQEAATIAQYDNSVKIWDISSLNISPVFRLKDESDRTPPQIYVANPPNIQNDRVRFSGDIIDIRGSVIDESGVRRLRINGIDTPLKDNGSFVINLPLVAGDNFVTMEVTDVNDNIALKKFIISRKDLVGGDYDAREANNYLFVVGINDYQYWPKLNNAVKDATDVAGTLMGQYDFDFSNVTIIKNEQATRSNIYKGLRSLISQVTTKDNLMIYFSGHGYFDELVNEGYWVPVDAKLSSTGDYLSNSDILKIIGNIESQHTFLVADACFSGSLFNETTRGYAENVEQYRSRWGLASGRLEVVSDGTEGNNSPFARNFISFLKNNPKDKIAVSELVQHVKMQVAEETDQTPIGNPLKGAGDEGGEFVFYKKN